MSKLTISDILPNKKEQEYALLMKRVMNDIRVAIPGVIQSFNPTEQTVSVQPSVKEQVLNPDQTTSWVNLPLLVDVPIVMPRAGGFVLTMPVQKGDECLVIFADFCIDAAWQNGGTNNTQPDKRRHDLSDGFAIPFGFSQPHVIQNWDMTSARLQTVDGSSYISLKPGEIDLVAGTVKANGTVIG